MNPVQIPNRDRAGRFAEGAAADPGQLRLVADDDFPTSWDPDDAAGWRTRGVGFQEAADWYDAGFSAFFADSWRRNGFGPAQAAAWRERGFNAADAKLWVEERFTVDQAVQLSDVGLRPVQARAWVSEGLPLPPAETTYPLTEQAEEDLVRIEQADMDAILAGEPYQAPFDPDTAVEPELAPWERVRAVSVAPADGTDDEFAEPDCRFCGGYGHGQQDHARF